MRGTFGDCQHHFHGGLDSPLTLLSIGASGTSRQSTTPTRAALSTFRSGPGATLHGRVSHISVMTSQDVDQTRRATIFERYLDSWRLTPDGEPMATRSSRLLPVRRDGEPAMLKIATEMEERRGADTMVWWGGEGAARVLAHEDDALLIERAVGASSLEKMVRSGHDDETTRILCAATARLHAPRAQPPPALLAPLSDWFAELEPGAVRYGGLLGLAAATARELLADPQDVVVLHGDIHHGNILDFGTRGWLAIDPKGLLGERGFDYVNILRNPDDEAALAPGRFARQAMLIAEAAGLDRVRFLQWVLAFAGLSAAWILGDGDAPDLDLAVAALAAAELEQCAAQT
jgi:streptomycin 6-kinase